MVIYNFSIPLKSIEIHKKYLTGPLAGTVVTEYIDTAVPEEYIKDTIWKEYTTGHLWCIEEVFKEAAMAPSSN